jgi:hypothetical protein
MNCTDSTYGTELFKMCSTVKNDNLIQLIEQVTVLPVYPEEIYQYINNDDAFVALFIEEVFIKLKFD